MVHQTVEGHMTQGAEKSAHSHGRLGSLGLHKPRQPMVCDLFVPLSQKIVTNVWCNKRHEVRNHQCTKNGVCGAMKHVSPGQHPHTRFNVYGNLSDAEGDHTEVSVKPWLGNERSAHVEWRKRQFQSPNASVLNAPLESKIVLHEAEW